MVSHEWWDGGLVVLLRQRFNLKYHQLNQMAKLLCAVAESG